MCLLLGSRRAERHRRTSTAIGTGTGDAYVDRDWDRDTGSDGDDVSSVVGVVVVVDAAVESPPDVDFYIYNK